MTGFSRARVTGKVTLYRTNPELMGGSLLPTTNAHYLEPTPSAATTTSAVRLRPSDRTTPAWSSASKNSEAVAENSTGMPS
ncbi:hypothetical protein EYZ11_013047 [Aspergillus tanneri]|uniref:Uncharacterized protein n=1 Tax=Aspergillus tanneri TaxID=1220188 RepID=A0A4S3IYX4_9EURO|nr:hypothetical protein EYZ11_013047 [Aspergillus tanneri]